MVNRCHHIAYKWASIRFTAFQFCFWAHVWSPCSTLMCRLRWANSTLRKLKKQIFRDAKIPTLFQHAIHFHWVQEWIVPKTLVVKTKGEITKGEWRINTSPLLYLSISQLSCRNPVFRHYLPLVRSVIVSSRPPKPNIGGITKQTLFY